jgi:glycerol kinase
MQSEHGVNAGPTRNGFLMQFTADMTGVELAVADVPESSALGAAMSGMRGMGSRTSLEDLAALPRQTRTYRRQMTPADVQRCCCGWQAAVKRLL